jgi:hypothetical protein
MNFRGWVYIISNPAMPGLLKVGFSRKDPHLRAQELNGTGCPQPYRVEYDVLVIAPQDVEQDIHQRLLSKRDGREWFRCSLQEAVAAVNAVAEGRLVQKNDGQLRQPESQFEGAKNPPASQDLESIAAAMPAYVRGNRSARWWYSQRTGQLSEKGGSRRFGPNQCRFDGAGGFPGFAIRDRLVPWVPMDDVELIE